MMELINLAKASALTSPNPVTLICTEKPDGTTNLATVSWWTILSFKPSMIGFAMSQKSFTGETVRNTGKVILTVPGEAIADAVMGCGSCSGRDTDKVARCGLEMQELPGTKIKVPVHSRVAVLATLKEYHEVGDHYLYICTVDEVYGNEAEEAVFAWKGYGEIRTAK